MLYFILSSTVLYATNSSAGFAVQFTVPVVCHIVENIPECNSPLLLIEPGVWLAVDIGTIIRYNGIILTIEGI